MLKREDEVIDGLHFTVVQFPAMYGFGLLARLAKTIGPVMGSLSGITPGTDLGTLGPQFADALAALDADEAQRLVLDILKSTSVVIPDATGGRKVEFSDRTKIDDVFSGRLKTMFKVVGFALRVNYADFNAGSDPAANVAPSIPAHSAS
jgi:hypothetical protein